MWANLWRSGSSSLGSFTSEVQLGFPSVPLQWGGQKDGCCGWVQFCSAGWGKHCCFTVLGFC